VIANPQPESGFFRQAQARAGAVPTLTRLDTLLALEAEAFAADDERHLRHIIVNHARRLAPYGQGIFLSKDAINGASDRRWIVKAISSQAVVDRATPLVSWLERAIGDNAGEKTFELRVREEEGWSLSGAYPYTHGLFLQLTPEAAVVFARSEEWTENDVLVLERLALAYGCAYRATARKTRARLPAASRNVRLALAATAAVILLWPMPMTTLAPAEVVATDPFNVTAPMDGVIEKVHVTPNSVVAPGDLLVTYVDADARGALAVAEEEVRVAEARLQRATLTAFEDPRETREINIMQAEMELAQSRRDYALEVLGRLELRADSAGVAVFSDVDEWYGRPVATGERILSIADPKSVELRIEGPLSDPACLVAGARVHLFLDAEPLHAYSGRLIRANLHAESVPGGGLAFPATAKLEGGRSPRIGARGVAKIEGARAPLLYWLLRRPLVAIRQMVGL
jgi:hypothetical protein